MNRNPLAATGLGLVLSLAWTAPALAYIGPGAGLSLLGALWGVVAAVAAALLFLLIWPLRRLMKRRRTAPVTSSTSASATARNPESKSAEKTYYD
ncbi:hypothetical protein [Pelagibius sp.]|uniref:hypothetical protein n=1 Tax=Pelagibius sp. TaxID=1931238 RepID=UPI00260A84C3|nr:hypothetical protein [Pelagibius sp.]